MSGVWSWFVNSVSYYITTQFMVDYFKQLTVSIEINDEF